MALWLLRGGQNGEAEKNFLEEGHICMGWDELNEDLSKLKTKEAMRKALVSAYPDAPKGKISNNLGQLWLFVHEPKPGDLVAMPLKHTPAIQFGEIVGDYEFLGSKVTTYRHCRKVKWTGESVQRKKIPQDILYSLGAFMTFCQVQRNDAEARIRKLLAGATTPSAAHGAELVEEPLPDDSADLERLGMDQIARLINSRFKGHDMERLVDAILAAQGFETLASPPGADKGIDILAAPGTLGFGSPRICVQVKSSDVPVDHPTLQQLLGAMQSVGADFGLLVAWGGFKSSVDKVQQQHFFKVRLWGPDELISELFKVYDRLDEDIKSELPLKRVWTVAAQDIE